MLKLLATAALASAFVLSSAAITTVSAEGRIMRSHQGGASHQRLRAHRPAARAFRPALRPHPTHTRPAHARPRSVHRRSISHVAHQRRGSARHSRTISHVVHQRRGSARHRRTISHAAHRRRGSARHWRHGSRWHRRRASHARYGSRVHWRHGSHWRLYSHRRYGSSWGYPVPVPVPTGVTTYAAAEPAPACTCLIKDYLENGAVRFTDVCTKEYAINPPPVPAEDPGPASKN